MVIITILLGIAGWFLAGYLGHAMNLFDAGEPAGFIGAVIGAMILLSLVFKPIFKRTRTALRRG